MEKLMNAMLEVMTAEQKMALVTGECSVSDAVKWFKSLNGASRDDIKSGNIKL